MLGLRALQWWGLLGAAAAALLFLAPAHGGLPEAARSQGPALRQERDPPPLFTALEDDYRRLRVGPFLAKIGGPPLTYCIDTSQPGPVDLATNASAVIAAFETWDGELTAGGADQTNLFEPANSSDLTDCTSALGKVRWASLGPGVVGQASLVFDDPDFGTKTIPVTGFTISLNEDLTNWDVNAGGGKYGVKDAITHEAGHVLGLDGLNPLKDMCLTMFRAAFTTDTRMQTLGLGDKLGAHAIYGGTPTDTASTCAS